MPVITVCGIRCEERLGFQKTLNTIACLQRRGDGGTKAPPGKGTFFTLQVYKRVGISRVEAYERVGKSVI